jgi:MFS family permease
MLAFLPTNKGFEFFVLSLVVRFIMGFGDALVLTTNNAIVCLTWGEQKSKYLAMTLGGSGLGTISAPVIGGLIYGFF